MRRLILPCLGFLLALTGNRAVAAIDPTELAAEQLTAALPGYDIKITDKLTIVISKPGQPKGLRMQANLDRVADFCRRVPEGCAREVGDFVTKLVPVIRLAQNHGVSASNLRAVLRPTSYVAQLTGMLKGKSASLVAAPFAGDVSMLCYVDMPTAMRPLLTPDLTQIGLSPDQALATCLANTRAALPHLPAAFPAPSGTKGQGEIAMLNGDPYDSSYLLLHDDWAPLAGSLGGHLLVAAPGTDLVLYARDVGRTAVDAMAVLAHHAESEAERPISGQVFRWTATGWEVASP